MKDITAGKPKLVYVFSRSHALAMGHTNKRDKVGKSYRNQHA